MPSVPDNHRRTAMRYFRFSLLVLSVLVLWATVALGAHEIHLKNGTVIRTARVQRSGGQVTYEQYGGVVSIAVSEVAEIKYNVVSPARPRASVPRQSGTLAPFAQDESSAVSIPPIPEDTIPAAIASSDRDLAARLAASILSSSPLAAANLAVVAIKTQAGYGSGFFVNDQGLIVTNRHVVRGSERNNSQVEAKVAVAEKELARWRTILNQDREQLAIFQRRLEGDRDLYSKRVEKYGNRLDPQWRATVAQDLGEREKALQKWQRELAQRTAEYQRREQEFRRDRDAWRSANDELARQSRFTVILADQSEQSALLYRVSDRYDLALLKVNGYRTPFLRPAVADAFAYGRQVYAIGAPLKLNNSVTSGVVSGLRDYYVQTDARIYPGNSGGPLVSEDGQVLGVNTMKLITEKYEGLGFAIHFDKVREEFKDFF